MQLPSLLHYGLVSGFMVIFCQRLSPIKGCLPSKVVFHRRSSSIKGRLLPLSSPPGDPHATHEVNQAKWAWSFRQKKKTGNTDNHTDRNWHVGPGLTSLALDKNRNCSSLTRMISALRRSFFANLITFERHSGLKNMSLLKIAILKMGWLS